MTKQYKVRFPGLRVRKQPTTAAQIVGMLREGAVIDVEHNVTVGANIWHALGVSAGGAPLLASDDMGAAGLVYAAHIHSGTQFTDEVGAVTPPPPSTRPAYRIGVHVIGNMRAAETALAAGAPVIFGMHDHLKMHQLALAYPDRIFIYRGYSTGRPSPRDVFNLLQVGKDNPTNLWYVGLNENDQFGDDPEALRGRVLWDKDLFHMLKDVRSDIRYFGLSLGHGCPGGIEDPNGPVTAALMGYADLWNEGMGIDLHNYTKGKRFADDPVSDSPINDPIWFEKRGDFWFRNGILDPRKGGGFIHGETGVEANHGGYLWAGYNQQQFGRHVRTLRDLGRSPITVPGGPYAGTWPSVDVAGAIYQMGDTNTGPGGWAGYNVETYLPELRTFWSEGG